MHTKKRPDAHGYLWFARGGDIAKCGPYSTQVKATDAMRLSDSTLERPVFPDDVFVWPEMPEVGETPEDREDRERQEAQEGLDPSVLVLTMADARKGCTFEDAKLTDFMGRTKAFAAADIILLVHKDTMRPLKSRYKVWQYNPLWAER